MMEKIAYSMKEAVEVTGIGRTTLYSHIADGNLKAVRVGGRTIIPADELRRFVNEGCEAARAYR